MQIKQRRKNLIYNKAVFISCIVPVHNESAVIKSFISQLHACLNNLTYEFEIIIIDDGSKDNTVEKILEFPSSSRVKLLSLSRNFGKEIALTAGLEHCSGEVAILLDADFQHPIEILPTFLEEWGNGYDMVYGVRDSRASESIIKRTFSKMFYWLMAKITNMDMPSNAGDFRLIDRKVINALNQFSERTRMMKGLYAWVGFNKKEVLFTVQERRGGKSSWGLGRLTELAITGITSFSDVPLRVWSWVGFTISSISLIYAIYIVITTLIFGADLPGFPTVVVAIMFLGGVQLLSIGILGEYIARIFTEVKKRPKYLIQSKHGFSE